MEILANRAIIILLPPLYLPGVIFHFILVIVAVVRFLNWFVVFNYTLLWLNTYVFVYKVYFYLLILSMDFWRRLRFVWSSHDLFVFYLFHYLKSIFNKVVMRAVVSMYNIIFQIFIVGKHVITYLIWKELTSEVFI
jgi:hypothetical protein